MLRKPNFLTAPRIGILVVVAFSHPCGVLAQQSIPGGVMSGGTATGVDVKDDLKGFHQAIALQATNLQAAQYNSMLKTAASAASELQAFLQQLNAPKSPPEIASRGTGLQRALETALSENRKFLEGLSDQQKSGLKETTRKLEKSDSDLADRVRELEQQLVDSKRSDQLGSLAQALESDLTSFRSQQLDLGKAMSIADPGTSKDHALQISPVKNTVAFGDQPVAIITSGVISKTASEAGQDTFALELTADLSDLQENIASVLHAQLDQENRCGDRFEVRDGTLTPLDPSSLVVTQFHFERWACFGRNAENEMVEGDGTLGVQLTPAVSQDGAVTLQAQITRMDAHGLTGELLRSGQLGESLRDKIADSILSAVRHSGDLASMLPPVVQGHAMLRRVQFQGTGSGRLLIVLDGDITLPQDKTAVMTSELKERASSAQNRQTSEPH